MEMFTFEDTQFWNIPGYMKRFNQIAFIAVILIAFVLILLKAIHLPVVNDETPTPTYYIHCTLWQIMMYPDHWPNNHILNTLFTKLFVYLFGNEQLVIRMPNMLFFLVYAVGIFRINRIMLGYDSVFFIPATLLFISNPYFLDFFVLCRGYGISCALTALSSSYLITGFHKSKHREIWIAWVLAMLASYANFTALVFWFAVCGMVLFYFFMNKKNKPGFLIRQILVLGVLVILYLGLIANPLIKMHSSNEFQYWTSKGFYWDTIYPFIEYSRNGSHLILNPSSHLIATFIFLSLTGNVLFIMHQFRKSGFIAANLRHPVFVATLLILTTVFINIFQCKVFGTPNLHGRTALFLYPLFIASFAGTLKWFSMIRIRWMHITVSFAFAFICIFHLADRFRMNWVRDWWHDSDTLAVLQYLHEQSADKPVTLKTTWFCYNSFYYYVFTDKVPWLVLEDYDKSIDPNTRATYYYLFLKDLPVLKPKFEPVRYYGYDRVLARRRESESVVLH
jgi:hypothetical protein